VATIVRDGCGKAETGFDCVYVKLFDVAERIGYTPLNVGSVRKKPDWIGFGVLGAGTELIVTVCPGTSRCGTVVVIVTLLVTVLPETLFVRVAPAGLTMGELPPALSVGGKVSATTADEIVVELLFLMLS
jgi:hypothetical protein